MGRRLSPAHRHPPVRSSESGATSTHGMSVWAAATHAKRPRRPGTHRRMSRRDSGAARLTRSLRLCRRAAQGFSGSCIERIELATPTGEAGTGPAGGSPSRSFAGLGPGQRPGPGTGPHHCRLGGNTSWTQCCSCGPGRCQPGKPRPTVTLSWGWRLGATLPAPKTGLAGAT